MRDNKNISENDMSSILSGGQDVMRLHQDVKDGYIDITFYTIAPGIWLAKNNIHADVVPMFDIPGNLSGQKPVILNHCISGRCEFRLEGKGYSYVDSGLMSIGTQTVQDEFYYPASYYMGYEIYAFPGLLTAEMRTQLGAFGIDMDALTDKYGRFVCCDAPEQLSSIWRALYDAGDECDIGYARLMTFQVLHFLCKHDTLINRKNYYLTKTQSLLAKQAHDILLEDISRHVSMKSVAESMGVSETSLKNYFRMVYGTNVSQYMNEKRMSCACELLSDTALNISDIARACGYVNQGRFARLFYEYSGMKPLDYRRKSKSDRKGS